jgi:hypothetical protein
MKTMRRDEMTEDERYWYDRGLSDAAADKRSLFRDSAHRGIYAPGCETGWTPEEESEKGAAYLAGYAAGS